MIRRYAKKALLAMAMLCSLSAAAQDRFIKVVTQAALPIGHFEATEGGVGLHLGHNAHKLNLQVTANYAALLTVLSEDDTDPYAPSAPDDGMGVRYRRLSVPVELHWRSPADELGAMYLLAGGVYNLNLSGECVSDASSEPLFTLRDGLRRQSFAARLGAGITISYSDNASLGAKAYVDVHITSPIRKYSISDRLFEYHGSIEGAFGRSTFVLAAYLTF